MIAHWNEVERNRAEQGPLASWVRELGTAAGTKNVGVNRWEIDPGKRSTPVHAELAEEEIYFVLGGNGLAWQDGKTHEIRAGDCIVHVAAHIRAGEEGMTYLAYGTREPSDIAYYPRSNEIAFRGVGLVARLEHVPSEE